MIDLAVAQLTGKTVMTVEQLTVNHDTRANTGTEGDNDEVFHASSRTVYHLALRSRVGIIGDGTFDAHALANEFSQRHYPFPREVRSQLDAARIEITVRRTTTDTNDVRHRQSLVRHQALETGTEHIAVLIDIWVLRRRDRVPTEHFTFVIH